MRWSGAVQKLRLHVCTLAFLFCMLAVSAEAQEQRRAIALLIDTSNSMNDQPSGWKTSKIQEVRRQLAEFCEELPLGTEVMVFTFDKKPPRPGLRRTILGPEDRGALRAYFAGLRARGQATHAWSSLQVVLGEIREMLTANPGLDATLIMYSDGEDNEVGGPELKAVLDEFSDLLCDIQPFVVGINFQLGKADRESLENRCVKVVTATNRIEIVPLILAFRYQPTTGITTESEVQFLDETNATIDQRRWEFGDGGTSTERNPRHRYDKPGTYTVRLSVTDDRGRHGTKEVVLEVGAPEDISVAGRCAPETVGVGETVAFTNMSRGGATSFLWDFGDGTTSDAEHPAHAYAQPGRYEVRLTARRGNEEVTEHVATVVVMGTPPPVPKIFGPRRVMVGEPAVFLDASRGEIERRSWIFGDGETETDETEVSHVYTEPGTYTVSLEVVGPGGDAKGALEVEVIPPPAPRAAFVFAPAQPGVGDEVTFVDGTREPVDAAVWEFGDGSPAERVTYGEHTDVAERTVKHVYASSGEFEVSLSVAGPGGESHATQSIVIRAMPLPTPAIEVITERPRVNEPVVFLDRSTGPVRSVTWSFGDRTEDVTVEYGEPPDPERRRVEHTWEGAGTYEVTLTARNAIGHEQTTTMTVSVAGYTPPRASIKGPGEAITGKAVALTDTSDGDIDSVTWDFGDGTEPRTIDYGRSQDLTRRVVDHTFVEPGTYVVRLTARGPAGAETAEHSLEVTTETLPEARFRVEPDGGRISRGQERLRVRLFNESTGPITKYIWDFGDGSEPAVHDTKKDVEHDYAPGRWTPVLTVEGLPGIAPQRTALETPLVVKPPLAWSRWPLNLLWIVPLAAVALGLVIGIGMWLVDGRARAQAGRLDASIQYRRAGDITAGWEEVLISGQLSPHEFELPGDPPRRFALRKHLTRQGFAVYEGEYQLVAVTENQGTYAESVTLTPNTPTTFAGYEFELIER